MSINLSAIFSPPAGVINNQISYARIDNTTTPVFIQAGNFITSPALIAQNIAAGQYQVNIVPIYPDGRSCDPTTYQTPACPGLIAISGYIQSNNLVVTYTAPATVPKVRITVGFPNGGSNVANYVNAGTSIVIPLPSGLTGDFTIQGQSVCDESSAFYSALSSTVVVTVGSPVAGTFALNVNLANVCNSTPTVYYTNGAFAIGVALYTDAGLHVLVTGYNYVVYNNAVYNIDPVTAIIGAALGNTCNATITGSNGMSASIPVANGYIYAASGSTVNVTISAGGPSGGTYTCQFYIPSQTISETTTNGTNTISFTMPPSGSVAWNATYTSSNSDGGAAITVS